MEDRDLYLKIYIQKQESLLLDYLRKSVDSDIRVALLESELKDTVKKYEESQKQVELGNEMMNQAAKGLEAATIENKQLQEKNEELQTSLTTTQQDKDKFYQELVNIKNSSEGSERRVNELVQEMKKQTEELTALYNENESLKKKLPKPPPELNKKIKKDLPVTLPPDEF